MDTVVTEMPVRRFERFPRVPGLVAAGLLVVGVIGWVIAVTTDADRAWRAYLFNWLFFTGIAAGAVMFAGAVWIVNAVWARTVRRLSISTVGFLPIAYLLFIPLLFVGPHVLPWTVHGAGAQAGYLNMPFLAARDLVLLAVLFLVQIVFVYWALRPDAGLLRETGDPGARRRLFDFLSRNWRGQEVEEARASRRLSRIAPIMGLCYAVTLSFIAFDFVMSLEEEWWSTLIGAYFFMGAFLGGIAVTIVLAVTYRRVFAVEDIIERSTLHDLGKLAFAFCIFWAYTFWAQYIVIWYGQLPHEQAFVVHRLGGAFRPLSIMVLCLMFIGPFFGLLGVTPKRRPGLLLGMVLVILSGLWFERYILTYPSWYHGVSNVPLGWQEIFTGMAFLGLFIAALLWFASTFPIIQIWEPLWEPELAERPDQFQTAV